MAFVDKSYRDRNYNSPNPLRRFAHRTRFRKSIESIEMKDGISIMDFGAGDGLFLNQLEGINTSLRLVGFEPYMESIQENKIQIIKDWTQVLEISSNSALFDYVTCFEVLEHFSPSNQHEALKKMHSIVKDSGRVIISVPIEKGIPAVVKNLIRRVNMPQSNHIFTYSNIFSSFLGKSLLNLRQDQDICHIWGFITPIWRRR